MKILQKLAQKIDNRHLAKGRILAVCISFALLGPFLPIQASAQSKTQTPAAKQPTQLLVTYTTGRKPSTRLLKKAKTVTTSGGETVALTPSTTIHNLQKQLGQMQKTPGVLAVQPNYRYTLQSAAGVNDPFDALSSPYNMHNQWWVYASHFPTAWKHARSEHKVTVAVLDSAIDSTHPDLANNILVSESFDAVTSLKNSSLDQSPADPALNPHGTHVAGIISAVANNGVGLAGGSYNANILPMRTSDNTGASDTGTIHLALMHLINEIESGNRHNIRVVNMSLAMNPDHDAQGNVIFYPDDKLMKSDIAHLRKLGVAVVCAGGNNTGSNPVYPSDWPDSISVTALNNSNSPASFSGLNANKNISAPGTGIWSTWPNGTYSSLSGTSQAAAVVSGAFSLLFAENPAASLDQAKQAVYATAGPISSVRLGGANGTHGSLNTADAVGYLSYQSKSGNSYSDVPENQWYYPAVTYMGWKNIMQGYRPSSNTFGPEDPLTREQAVTLLWREQGKPSDGSATHFKDSNRIHGWAKPAVAWAQKHRIITGYGSTREFRPTNPLNRQEMAAIIARTAHANVSDNGAEAISQFEGMINHDKTDPGLRNSVIWAVGTGVLNGFSTKDGRDLAPTQPVRRGQMAQIMQNAVRQHIISE